MPTFIPWAQKGVSLMVNGSAGGPLGATVLVGTSVFDFRAPTLPTGDGALGRYLATWVCASGHLGRAAQHH